ncbi:transposase [Bifidobacterium lemurum]|uniref:Transposase n=1 Tax=Bifidobacterium lemurum TaxID=1603886 RepID=A0A261FN96_9BIFI|nr:HTH domain-containing protein [Bifidobacterium lemurum]OZG60651.1 transposase [Bifidobacterium lemurum]QOL34828.1 transposase [Bifidobacterium lemurum]
MTDTSFTPEQLEYLRMLPAVKSVNGSHIYYSSQFQKECMRRYAQGERPSKIFRDAGLSPQIIGHKRIERCIARWKQLDHLSDGEDGDEGDEIFNMRRDPVDDNRMLLQLLMQQSNYTQVLQQENTKLRETVKRLTAEADGLRQQQQQ